MPAVQTTDRRVRSFVEDAGAREPAQGLVDVGVVETGMGRDLGRRPPRIGVASDGPIHGVLGRRAQVGSGEADQRARNRTLSRTFVRLACVWCGHRFRPLEACDVPRGGRPWAGRAWM